MGIGQRFLDLLERSVIVQCALPIMFGGASIALALQGREVPNWLLSMTWATLTFWMGAKGQHAVDTMRQSRYDH